MSPEPAGAAEPPDMSEPMAEPPPAGVVFAAFLWWQPASAAETKIATTNDIFFISLVLSLVLFSPLAPARQQKKSGYLPAAQGSAPPLVVGVPPAGVIVPP